MSNSTPSSTAQTAAENSYRDQVRDALRLYLDDKSISQSDFAKQADLSNATVTQVLNGTYAAQGDVMHNKIATYLRKMGVSVDSSDGGATVWKTLETANYATMRQTIAHAQQRRGIYCICGDTGSGKTTAMTDIARKMPTATYLLCDYLMTKKAFVSELAQAMGVRIASNNIRDLVQAICDNVRSKKGAVLLLDDVGKLPQAVYPIIQLIYDSCGEQNVGLVLAGMPLLAETLKKGTRKQRLGFPELSRRIVNKEWYLMQPPTKAEITQIAAMYGISDTGAVAFLIEHCKEYQALRDLILGALSIANGKAITRSVLVGVNNG